MALVLQFIFQVEDFIMDFQVNDLIGVLLGSCREIMMDLGDFGEHLIEFWDKSEFLPFECGDLSVDLFE